VFLSAADGIPLCGWGYRSTDEKIALPQTCGTSYCAFYDMPSSECGPPTARPGSSQHELGVAIDSPERQNATTLDCSDAGYVWLSSNAASYGLHNLPSECWHGAPTAHEVGLPAAALTHPMVRVPEPWVRWVARSTRRTR
jgi:hypothetical protein